jgi:hypothetical protein
MGTRRVQMLTDSVICRLYQNGHSRLDIGLKAKLYDPEVCAILRANGIPLRNNAEGQRIARERRNRLRVPRV